MADDRYCFIHNNNNNSSESSDDFDHDDEWSDWRVVDLDHIEQSEEISIPSQHLPPPLQDELDDSLLPSQTHPSYPFGNPYRNDLNSLLNQTTTTTTTRGGRPPLNSSSCSVAKLSTNLSSLELPRLYSLTNFLSDPLEKIWSEQGLNSLFGEKTRKEFDEDLKEFEKVFNTHGDAGPPAGQNAADGNTDDEDDDDGQEEEDDDQGSQVEGELTNQTGIGGQVVA